MASVTSSTSSLSSTLQGYGGMASGIDRDSIIEQMTSGTQAKITKAKQEKQELQWKQEAYRGLSDKILDLQDNYMSYASAFNIKDSSNFAQNLLSVLGDSDVTKYVSASGVSSMLKHLSIIGARQTATSATLLSKTRSGERSRNVEDITTSNSIKMNEKVKTSNLSGTKLEIGSDQIDSNGNIDKFSTQFTFNFVSSYTNSKGNTVEIDYTADPADLAEELNKYVKEKEIQFDADSNSYKTIEFAYDEGNDQLTFKLVQKNKWTHEYYVTDKVNGSNISNSDLRIRTTSSALEGLGYDSKERESLLKAEIEEKVQNEIDAGDVAADQKEAEVAKRLAKALKEGITFGTDTAQYNKATKKFTESYVEERTMKEYLEDKKLTVTYGGQTAEITLLTKEDVTAMEGKSDEEQMAYLAEAIQNRLNKAFGSGKVSANIDAAGKLSFGNAGSEDEQTITVNSDDYELRKVLGIEKNQSNKLSVDASLEKNFGIADEGELEFVINGVKLEGVTKDTTVNELIAMINENDDVGVEATYMNTTGQIVFVASDTGSGREITLGGSVAEAIFGTASEIEADKRSKDGQDAEIEISYGNGVSQVLTSSTNTFNIDGVKVTVSGTFGYKTNEDGEIPKDEHDKKIYTADTSQTVRFEAKADADKITENVKKFIEEYNALVDALYKETSTKPDSEYGALTEDQKSEMSDDEIKKWEEKAQQGLLYRDSTVKQLYSALQNLSSEILNNGISYEDLEAIGITFSDSRADYGKLIFDETTFKEAVASDPDKVSDIFTGGGDVKTGIAELIENTLTPYATRYATKNGNSYGSLIEEAGSEKLVLSITDNYIYEQLKQMDEQIETLKARLESEQDRYIQRFTTMESLISQYNTQASYISGLTG